MAGDDPEVGQQPAGGGQSWSWDLDLDMLLAAVSEVSPADAGAGPGLAGDDLAGDDLAEAEFAEYLEAVDAGRSVVVPLSVVAARIAESLPPGPDLAAWLASAPAGTADERALTGMASSYRRVASWAQAGELAAVAQLASRSAAADHRIGAGEDGRPARVPQDACGQVSLALTMSQGSASWWADLAVTLTWRLPATGAALRSGVIDLSRARAITEATAVLDEQTARAVEAAVLPKAGLRTLGQLRAALRRAVIAADPAGADRRREEAERRARVTLYPDAEGTAGLAGYSLPAISATAAMARITALAQAMKASGSRGGIDLLRSRVYLGLLLGTLPYIPPAPGSPPDDNCPPNDDCPPGKSYDADGSSADDVLPPGLAGWPAVPAFVRRGPAAMGHLVPAGGGFLGLTAPWSTLTGQSTEPGSVGRLGAVTPAQASYLAHLAARDPGVDWRVIVTGPDGQATAAGAVRRRHPRAGPAPPVPPSARQRPGQCGLIRRVTVTVTRKDLAAAQESGGQADDGGLPAKLAQVLAAAHRAADHATQIAADNSAEAGCAHSEATDAYRPPPRLAEFIAARDVTCRFPTCRQPAARCDIDHTRPYDQHGKTCSCNLGELCRYHHELKQHPRWRLTQPQPGVFTWITPAGRTYTTVPDSHAA
ncbi:MAG TPA: DUF222 domain-containing protein [Streptosporangiaceae bacterium]|nr:DUF222 domain-containing protein [Streptosporangiaceae bacterium]